MDVRDVVSNEPLLNRLDFPVMPMLDECLDDFRHAADDNIFAQQLAKAAVDDLRHRLASVEIST